MRTLGLLSVKIVLIFRCLTKYQEIDFNNYIGEDEEIQDIITGRYNCTLITIDSSGNWTIIAVGNFHTCGIDNGNLKCWGQSNFFPVWLRNRLISGNNPAY